MTEQEQLSDEARTKTGRDLSSFSSWRDDTDLCVLSDLSLYGTYLSGQTNGMSNSLPLPSVVSALEIEGVERHEWPERTVRLLRIHAGVVGVMEQRQRMNRNG